MKHSVQACRRYEEEKEEEDSA